MKGRSEDGCHVMHGHLVLPAVLRDSVLKQKNEGLKIMFNIRSKEQYNQVHCSYTIEPIHILYLDNIFVFL